MHILVIAQLVIFVGLCSSLQANSSLPSTVSADYQSALSFNKDNSHYLKQYESSVFLPAFSNTGKKGTKAIPSLISEVETEDELNASGKYYTAVSKFFFSVLQTEHIEVPFYLSGHDLPFHKHLSCALYTRLQALLQVFRL